MSEELCAREHHNFLPESSVLIWLKPLKDFYSLSLIWWQETRLCVPFILCWFYKLTCNKCMYNVCFAWHSMLVLLRICILSVFANTFWAWRRESEMTVWIPSWKPSLYFIQSSLSCCRSSYRTEENAICLWHWAKDQGARFGNPGEVSPVFPLQSTG